MFLSLCAYRAESSASAEGANITSHLLRINKRTRGSSVSIHYFLEIFKSRRVYDTLREMHETGVLGRFVPEFGALRCLVVHEPYHMYTVDEHTLLAIKNLENLKTTKLRTPGGAQRNYQQPGKT